VHHSRKGRIHAMRAAVFLLFYLPCLFMITLAVCVMAFSESAKRDPLRGRLLRFELSAFAYFLIDFLLTYSLLAFYGFDIFSGSAGATGIMKISMPIYAGYAVSNVAQFSLYYSICLIFLGLCGMPLDDRVLYLFAFPVQLEAGRRRNLREHSRGQLDRHALGFHPAHRRLGRLVDQEAGSVEGQA
jgi:hypothetical protein